MNIRKITREDYMAGEMLESLSFVIPLADNHEEKLAKESFQPDRWGIFSDSGTMAATLTNFDIPVYLDGREIPARGIGGVASDPVTRGQGHVRALLQHLLKTDRAEGKLVSALYPFSHAFYRKFGYELCYEHKKAIFPIGELKAFRPETPPQARLLTPGDSMAALMPIYAAFAKQFSFMAARNEQSWARFTIAEPRKAEKYWYVLSQNGQDTAYVIFSYIIGDKPYKRTLWIRDYAFTGKQGLADMMCFLHRFAAQAQKVEMVLPDSLPLSSLLEDASAIEISVAQRPMARVLHVENMLKAMRHPAEDGAYSVYVADDFLPENTGCYAVRYTKDGTVSVARSAEQADLRLSVQTFAQLVFGFLSLEEAAYKPDVEIPGSDAALRKVFAKKRLFMLDFY
ncbi:MAG: GNAT family N-acetyltransferase [Firmicutes bacterium]|nr:GNAT family N-acetyltransferase [Bacillota bacterium]